MVQNVAEREEKIRDLTQQVTELEGESEAEVLFQHIAPRRRRITLYSTADGEPIPVPQYMIRAALSATGPDGKARFVAKKEDAPEYKRGNVKCFLHPESPERPVLEEIGLAGASCPAKHLASGHAKRAHGLHRHKQEWAALQDYLNDQKEQRRERRLDQQLEATLDIARGPAAPAPPSPAHEEEASPVCNSCGEAIEGALADHQCK